MSIHDLRVGRLVTALVGAVALSLPSVQAVAAQGAHRSAAVDSIRQIQQMSPTFGPIGTVVHLSTENLPVQAKVHVGYGATRTGFEALFEVQQGMWGDIAAELTVPPSAPWDRAIVFVAFNAIFSPIGLSDPFHVVNEDGLVRRSGTITDESETCTTFRDQDDYLYALSGDLAALPVGTEVVIEGTYSPTGSCMGGSTIAVVSVSTGG